MTFEIEFEGLTVNNNAFIVKGLESLDRNNLKLE